MSSRNAARVFFSATAARNLRRTFELHLRGSHARGRDGITAGAIGDDIDQVARLLSLRMRDGTLRFTQYRQLLLSKGANKVPRVISVPTVRDRIALRCLADVLLELFPDARGSIPQAKIDDVRVALASGRYDAYVRADIENFYPSIRHDIVERLLKRRIRKPELLRLIMAAIGTPTVPDGSPKKPRMETLGVPQGLAVSNVVAEIVAQTVDSQFLERREIAYFRFVDDVLILCQRPTAEALFTEVSKHCSEAGLTVHPLGAESKSSLGQIAQGFDYLGYVFIGSTVSVRQASITRLDSTLARVFTRYGRAVASASTPAAQNLALARCQWEVNLVASGCIYKGAQRGWVQYFRQTNDLTLLKRLDAKVDRYAKRFSLPPHFRPKRFIRTYWALKHSADGRAARYVPDFDHYTVQEMRDFLVRIEQLAANGWSNSDVEQRFFQIIDRRVSELEADIAFTS